MDIRKSNASYEDWLRKELAGDVIEDDLEKKHGKMKEDAFVFLRATYWRWAEIIFDVCPELSSAPAVLAVGDIHVENFGTWRDVDGRLVWGVNDFDESAKMPFAVDLVRLAASALLGGGNKHADLEPGCNAIMAGYARGLSSPKPFVLDRDHQRMRTIFVASDDERAKFWKKMVGNNKVRGEQPGQRYLNALLGAMPEGNVQIDVWPRSSGTGSLGRPRWIGVGEWRGGPVVREAKAVVPSAWGRVPGRNARTTAIMEIARGRYRAPDPWYRLTRDDVIVRRLSPNNRKIEIDKDSGVLLELEMLEAMGHELANVHLGVGDRGAAIQRDLNTRDARWLVHATEKAADATLREFKEWRRD